MAQLLPRSNEGPVEAKRVPRGDFPIPLMLPLEGGGRLSLGLTDGEAAELHRCLEGSQPPPSASAGRDITYSRTSAPAVPGPPHVATVSPRGVAQEMVKKFIIRARQLGRPALPVMKYVGSIEPPTNKYGDWLYDEVKRVYEPDGKRAWPLSQNLVVLEETASIAVGWEVHDGSRKMVLWTPPKRSDYEVYQLQEGNGTRLASGIVLYVWQDIVEFTRNAAGQIVATLVRGDFPGPASSVLDPVLKA